jgi:hypothetical protein
MDHRNLAMGSVGLATARSTRNSKIRAGSAGKSSRSKARRIQGARSDVALNCVRAKPIDTPNCELPLTLWRRAILLGVREGVPQAVDTYQLGRGDRRNQANSASRSVEARLHVWYSWGVEHSSVMTENLASWAGPKVVEMATSAASRPRAMTIRPMRG